MLISSNRLKKYIDKSEKIDFVKIWDKFTIRCAEVESVKEVGNAFDSVVVAEIKECIKHPDSDHMHVLKVDIGEKDYIQVVCGAPNVKVGLKTAFVKVGGHINGMEIKSRLLRGVESFGMCCSGKELQISDASEGIIELPDNFKNGVDIKKLLPIEDIVVEIDNKSLTNRPDLWGHYGIAREIAALTGNKLIPLDKLEVENNKKGINIKIKKTNLCNRYCGIKIDNINNNRTPLNIQIFLYYVGLRSISLIVDLTNLLMLELGQPMHAFDSRKVPSIEIDVAKEGDIFKTLDGIERKLKKENLMIKSNDQYLGIAGIMGGFDSEITNDTTSIILESANFDASSVRKTSLQLGLRTEASTRFEKSLDPNMCSLAIKRFIYLLKDENPDMIIASNLTDVYPNVLKESTIVLTKEKLSIYMGKNLDDSEVKTILESLGFKVIINKDNYEVTIPTYRYGKDVSIPEDLIEEISRIHGFENIKEEPLKLALSSDKKEDIYEQEYDVKKLLAEKFNMHEIHSYLWYDSAFLKELEVKKTGIKLICRDQNNILRDDLSFSLLNIVRENFKNYNKFSLFEIGTIIEKGINKRRLSVIFAGDEKTVEVMYNQAKEVVKYIYGLLKNKKVIFIQNNEVKEYYDKKLSKNIIVDEHKMGEINVLNKELANKISKRKAVVCVDICFDKYVLLEKNNILAKEINKYPVVYLDYTVILPEGFKYYELSNVLEKFKNNIILDYYLIGKYQNKYTIRYVVGHKNKTLNQEDLQVFKEKFIDHILKNNFEIIK